MRWLALLLILLLAACRPLYLPPVPEPLAVAARLELDSSVALRQGRPVLELTAASVPAAGWLAIQWYGPANSQDASQSIWLTADDVGRTVVVSLPADVEPTSGRWRAVLSHAGVIVRQLSVEVPGTDLRDDE